MPQGVEVIETGRIMTDRGRLVLMRDDGGAWGLFLERNPRDWLGHRVTVRGTRFGFADLHVTGITRGSEIPPEQRAGGMLSIAVACSLSAAGGLAFVWSCLNTLWTLARTILT